MSRAPQSWSDEHSVNEHGRSWKAVMEMVRAGSSWSGRERNSVFLNSPILVGPGSFNGATAPTRFTNISAVSGLDFPDDGRAVAVVDWDQDGDQDIWFRNRTAPRLRLMRNRSRELSRDQQFLSLQLVGTSCNRDAIGARVELGVGDGSSKRRLVETVTAGDAFLSQSSRRLHFGLGSTGSVSITELTVHWPGGSAEVFDGVQPGSHYILTQGTGMPQPLNGRPVVRFARKEMLLPDPTSAARIILPGRVPFPELQLNDAGRQKEISSGDGPLLVTLWTSSCPNCRSELKRHANSRDRFRQANLSVLAICLDGLGTDAGTAAQAAAADYLREIQFPYPALTTTTESLQRIQYFQQALFDMHPDFVVPLSFLLDENRNVIAIYRGAFEVDVLLADAGLTREGNGTLRDLAIPFAGSWFTKPATDSQIAEIVGKQIFPRVPDEGIRCYERAIGTATDPNRKLKLTSDLVQTHVGLARAVAVQSEGKVGYHFREAIRWSPQSAAIRHEFGVHLANQGQYDEAEGQFREALRLRPDSATARKSLESLLNKKSQSSSK